MHETYTRMQNEWDSLATQKRTPFTEFAAAWKWPEHGSDITPTRESVVLRMI